MERDRFIRRLEALVAASSAIPIIDHPAVVDYSVSPAALMGGPARARTLRSSRTEIDQGALYAWCTRARAALAEVSPQALVQFEALGPPVQWYPGTIEAGRGIVEGVLADVRDGYLIETLAGRVRARTEGELLEQARLLCEQGDAWAAAAALLASAALELRLHDIAQRHNVTLGKKPTLGTVISALRDARSAGKPTVDPSNDSLHDRWLEMRNDAAHRSPTFRWTAAQVTAEFGPLEVYLRTV